MGYGKAEQSGKLELARFVRRSAQMFDRVEVKPGQTFEERPHGAIGLVARSLDVIGRHFSGQVCGRVEVANPYRGDRLEIELARWSRQDDPIGFTEMDAQARCGGERVRVEPNHIRAPRLKCRDDGSDSAIGYR
jgi:hypothetical protein